MKAVLLFAGLLAFCHGDHVRFRAVDDGNEGLPDYLHVNLEHVGRRSLNLPTSLKLTRNADIDHISFIVDDEESPADFKNVRFYQDPENGAVITANLVNTGDDTIRTLRGSFVKDGKSFEVEPTEIPNGNEGKRNIGQDFNAHVHTIRAMDENSTHSLDFDFPDGAHDDDNNGTRYRRAVDHYDVEMYWVSDPTMYKIFTSLHKTGTNGMKEYFGHQANGVSLVYSYISGMNKGISISTWVTKVYIKTTGTFNPTDGALTGVTNPNNLRKSVNEDTVLKLMETYKRTNRWTWNKPDHFMLYTGYDLSGDTVGYAPVGGVCTPERGISAIEYSGWHTWAISAHELGHNVGMRHDGSNSCSGRSGNVMSPSVVDLSTLTTVSNAFKFSSCSVDDAKKCLTGKDDYKYPRKCLKDTVCKNGFTVDTSKLPGQFVSLSDQCKDIYGDKVTGACSDNFGHDICKKVYCATTGRSCIAGAARAADGTKCANGKWCIEGQCVPTSKRPTQLAKPCKAGSSPNIPSSCRNQRNDCTSGNIFKFPGLNCPIFKSSCCRTCAEFGFV